MDELEFRALIEGGTETPQFEYKASQPWTAKPFREKIIRTILALTNIRDGGRVVIGVEEQPSGSYLPTGCEEDHVTTFVPDVMKDQVSECADPFVIFSVEHVAYNQKTFIVITVREFDEVPVICKKDGVELRRGAIYTRTRAGRPQSAPISNERDMREIIDLAVDKGNQKLKRRGYVLKGKEVSAKELFDMEREGL